MFAGCENGNMYSKLLVLWDLTHCKVEGPKISLEKERNVCNFLLFIQFHKISTYANFMGSFVFQSQNILSYEYLKVHLCHVWRAEYSFLI